MTYNSLQIFGKYQIVKTMLYDFSPCFEQRKPLMLRVVINRSFSILGLYRCCRLLAYIRNYRQQYLLTSMVRQSYYFVFIRYLRYHNTYIHGMYFNNYLNCKISSNIYKKVKGFKYLGSVLANQTLIHEQINCRQ